MTSVADYGDLDFRVVGHLLLFTMFVRSHRDLVSRWECLEAFVSSHVAIFKTGTHWVNIEEGIFAVLNVCDGLSVQSLKSLVANSGKI